MNSLFPNDQAVPTTPTAQSPVAVDSPVVTTRKVELIGKIPFLESQFFNSDLTNEDDKITANLDFQIADTTLQKQLQSYVRLADVSLRNHASV